MTKSLYEKICDIRAVPERIEFRRGGVGVASIYDNGSVNFEPDSFASSDALIVNFIAPKIDSIVGLAKMMDDENKALKAELESLRAAMAGCVE